MKELIGYAYSVRWWQIEGGPDWIDSLRWNVEAKADEKIVNAYPEPGDPLAPDVIALMLQSLLEDHFKLTIHHQTKESSVYSLVVADGGPKIELDPDQSPPVRFEPEMLKWQKELRRGEARIGSGSIEARAISITNFINGCLLFRSDRPIMDRTNLKDRYNIKMKWSLGGADLVRPTDASSPALDATRNFTPAFFAALQEQLGLMLESGEAPVDFLVITGVQKPSKN